MERLGLALGNRPAGRLTNDSLRLYIKGSKRPVRHKGCFFCFLQDRQSLCFSAQLTGHPTKQLNNKTTKQPIHNSYFYAGTWHQCQTKHLQKLKSLRKQWAPRGQSCQLAARRSWRKSAWPQRKRGTRQASSGAWLRFVRGLNIVWQRRLTPPPD